jgi:hypothetical protein
VLDLSHNLFPAPPLTSILLPSLNVNKTLTNVDLRGNPGYTRSVHMSAALSMLRNIEKMRKSGVRVEEKWINPEVLPGREMRVTEMKEVVFSGDEEVIGGGGEDKENKKRVNNEQRRRAAGGSKVKKVSLLRPEDFAPKINIMKAKPPMGKQGHTRA